MMVALRAACCPFLFSPFSESQLVMTVIKLILKKFTVIVLKSHFNLINWTMDDELLLSFFFFYFFSFSPYIYTKKSLLSTSLKDHAHYFCV